MIEYSVSAMVSISYLSTSAETVQKPILHVEARVKSDGDNVIIRTDIVGYLQHVISVVSWD